MEDKGTTNAEGNVSIWMELELLELEELEMELELEGCQGILDIPPRQSRILTSMNLKRLMSAQAAIVRPIPSLLYLLLAPQEKKKSL